MNSDNSKQKQDQDQEQKQKQVYLDSVNASLAILEVKQRGEEPSQELLDASNRARMLANFADEDEYERQGW